MDPDLTHLDTHLRATGVDGYLLDADGDDADQYYLSGFAAPDPFLTLYDGEVHLLFARSLEYGRAQRESRAATVERSTDFGYDDLAAEYGPREARARTLARFLEAHGVASVAVPPRFPLGTGDTLRDQGVTVTADEEGTRTIGLAPLLPVDLLDDFDLRSVTDTLREDLEQYPPRHFEEMLLLTGYSAWGGALRKAFSHP